MLILVDGRDTVLAGYASAFRKEGVVMMGQTPEGFSDWLASARRADILAVEAFVLGQYPCHDALLGTIRRKSAAPVIALTDSRRLENTLQLFAAGVDDVVEKPIHAREILARAGAIRRRSLPSAGASAGDIHVFGDGSDPMIGGAAMQLPRREQRILEYLSNHSGRWIDRDRMFTAIYGDCEEPVADKTLECHISKLRRKLRERLGYDPIECRRFVGYRLACKTEASGGGQGSRSAIKSQTSSGHVSLSL
ncbi:MAG: response regulator transcription factor [Rhizobiales bacterium]|nr:response regulator transcription factor [Hyphomicrobiales bacterium]